MPSAGGRGSKAATAAAAAVPKKATAANLTSAATDAADSLTTTEAGDVFFSPDEKSDSMQSLKMAMSIDDKAESESGKSDKQYFATPGADSEVFL